MTKAKKQRIKEIALKTLHIICYVLSAICLITYIVVAVNSCSAKKHDQQIDNSSSQLVPQQQLHINKAINPNIYNAYILKYSQGQHTLSENQINTLNELVDLPTTDVAPSSPYYQEHYIRFDGYTIIGNDTLPITNLYYRYAKFEAENGDEYYRLDIVRTFEYSSTIIGKASANAWSFLYDFTDAFFIMVNVESISEQDKALLEVFFTINNQINYFEFNKTFNYNAPENLPVGNQLWYQTGMDNSDIHAEYHIDYQIGYFTSNNLLFDTIRYVYKSSKGVSFIKEGEIFDENSAMNGADDYAFYYELMYINTSTNYELVVNYRNQYWYESAYGLPGYYFTDGTTWYNDTFRNITILAPLSEQNRIQLQAFNNNNQSSISGNVVSGGTYGDNNVFSLIGSAFTSLLPMLNIAILPGITLGILLFVPLVAMLVFAIIRIIKK